MRNSEIILIYNGFVNLLAIEKIEHMIPNK